MPHPRPSLRPATPTDLDRVAEIYAHYVVTTSITFDETPLTVAEWRDKLSGLAERAMPFLVAESASNGRPGDVIGFAYAAPWRPKPAYHHTVEDTIYLAPDQTCRGVGSALLAELVDRCTRVGLRQMVAVIADTGNAASLALHRRLGFGEVGRLTDVGHKHGRWIDTILMQRPLAR